MSPHERFGACVIVLDKTQKKVLLGKRKHSYGEGFMGMPGGRTELKEKLTETVKRELLEETNLVAQKIKYVGVVRELQGTYNFIHFGYVCLKYQGVLKNTEPDKSEKWQWFHLKKLPKNILPGHKAVVEMYLKKKIKVTDLLS